MRHVSIDHDIEINVEFDAQRWRWRLTAEGLVETQGEAPDAESAQRSAVFAKAAISALHRIRRRRGACGL